MKRSMLVLLALALPACSGTIYTVKSPKFDENGVTEGVLFYGYRMETVKTVLDRIRHKKTGDITHSMYEDPSSSRFCLPQIKETKVAVADYSTQYAIRYDAALFESNKFSVELDKGMPKAVNSESVPGAKTAVDALAGLNVAREDVLNGVAAALAEEADAEAFVPGMSRIPCTASE